MVVETRINAESLMKVIIVPRFWNAHWNGVREKMETLQVLVMAGNVGWFTSTETVGLLGTGAQDGHLHFHTAPDLLSLKYCFTSTETVGLLGTGAQDGHLHFHTAPDLLSLKYCFTSTETVGLLGTGAQDGHLHFHTAPELCRKCAISLPYNTHSVRYYKFLNVYIHICT